MFDRDGAAQVGFEGARLQDLGDLVELLEAFVVGPSTEGDRDVGGVHVLGDEDAALDLLQVLVEVEVAVGHGVLGEGVDDASDRLGEGGVVHLHLVASEDGDDVDVGVAELLLEDVHGP